MDNKVVSLNRFDWAKALQRAMESPGPIPHYLNREWRYLDANSHHTIDNGFAYRQRERMRKAGWIK